MLLTLVLAGHWLSFGQVEYFNRIIKEGVDELRFGTFQVSHDEAHVYCKVYSNKEPQTETNVGLMKLDSNMTPIWVKMVETSTDDGLHQGFVIDKFENIYVTFAENRSKTTRLMKLDSSGQVLWSKHVSSSNTWTKGKRVDQFSDNKFMIAGLVNATSTHVVPIIVMFDSLGALGASVSLGENNCFYYDATPTSDGGLIVMGSLLEPNEIPFDGLYDHALIKLDRNLDLEWAKRYHGYANDRDDKTPRGAIEEVDSGYVVAYLTNSYGYGNQDVVISLVDKKGDIKWAKVVGSNFNDIVVTGRLEVSRKGRIFVNINNDGGNGSKISRQVLMDLQGNVIDQLQYWDNEFSYSTYFKPHKDGWLIQGGQDNDDVRDAFFITTDFEGGSCENLTNELYQFHDIKDSIEVFDETLNIHDNDVSFGDLPVDFIDYSLPVDSFMCPSLNISTWPETACPGERIKLASNFDFDVRWLADSKGEQLLSNKYVYEPLFTQEQWYYLVDGAGRKDSVYVSIDPDASCLKISNQPLAEICAGDTVILNASLVDGLNWYDGGVPNQSLSNSDTVVWVVGSSNKIILVNDWGQADTLEVELTTSGCFEISYSGESSKCPGDVVEIGSNAKFDFKWFEPQDESKLIGTGNQIEWKINESSLLVVENQWGARDTLSLTIHDSLFCLDVQVFELITPNQDGINDYFTIRGLEKFKSNKVSVYNEWGNTIFAQTNYINGTWDGGKLPDGDYYYIVNLGDKQLNGRLRIQRE